VFSRIIYLAILSVITLFFYFFLKRILGEDMLKVRDDHELYRRQRESLVSENESLEEENRKLKITLEEIVALYEITKEICKYLEEDKIFISFKEQLKRHVAFEDCLSIRPDEDLGKYKGYIILPLEINKNISGYLAAAGIAPKDNEKFNILAQQYILGFKRAILYHQVQELAITDSLTSIFTRKHYLERLDEEIDYSKKFIYPLSLLMIDIDHFKDYNDRYGHLVGDAILRVVAKIIKDNLRQIDLIGRYGGEEFSVALTNTDKNGAILAAERIRQAVGANIVKVYDEELKVTISIGISVFSDDTQEAGALIENSDSALYKAKEAGRNRVCLFNA